MHLWKFITKLSENQKSWILSLGRMARFPSLLLIISYFDGEEGSEAIVNFEGDVRRLLKIARQEKDLPTLIFAYEAMGRIFFIRGFLVPAASQFREAIKLLRILKKKKKINERDYKIILAKLLSWLGLCYLNVGKFKNSAKVFGKAIKLLEELEYNKPIIGELKSLRGDALSFFDTEEALNEVEIAHEILLKHPSIILLTNAIKLFAALLVRNYKADALDILAEAFDKMLMPEILEDLSLSFYKNYQKLLRKIYYKVLKGLDLSFESDELTKKFIFGTEGAKGLYFIFRYFLKPVIHPKNLLAVNKTILIAEQLKLGGFRFLDEIMNKKEKIMESFERAYYLKFREGGTSFYLSKAYSMHDKVLETALNDLAKHYKKVALLSFERISEENIFILSFFDLTLGKSFFKKIKIEPNEVEEIIEMEDAIKRSEMIVNMLNIEPLIGYLSEFGDDDLLIISPIDFIHKIPFEAIFLGNGKFLGSSTNISRVPTLYLVPIWTILHNKLLRTFSTRKRKHIILDISFKNERKAILNILNKLKKEIRLKISQSIPLMRVGFANVYHISSDYSQLIDGVYSVISGQIFNPLDIEKISLPYEIVILNIPSAVEIQEFKYGYTNFAIAFLIAGVQSVIAVGKKMNWKIAVEFSKVFYNSLLKEHEKASLSALKARREILTRGFNDGLFFYFYGNPLTRV